MGGARHGPGRGFVPSPGRGVGGSPFAPRSSAPAAAGPSARRFQQQQHRRRAPPFVPLTEDEARVLLVQPDAKSTGVWEVSGTACLVCMACGCTPWKTVTICLNMDCCSFLQLQ